MFAHAEERLNNLELFGGTQSLSTPSNLHYLWVHSDFQDGGVNKAGPVPVNIWLYSHVYAFLYHQKGKSTHNYFIIIITQ